MKAKALNCGHSIGENRIGKIQYITIGPHGSETAKNTKAVATTGKAAMAHGYVKTNGVSRHYHLPDTKNNPRYEHQVQIHNNGSWTHYHQNGKKTKGDSPEQLHEHLSKLHGK